MDSISTLPERILLPPIDGDVLITFNDFIRRWNMTIPINIANLENRLEYEEKLISLEKGGKSETRDAHAKEGAYKTLSASWNLRVDDIDYCEMYVRETVSRGKPYTQSYHLDFYEHLCRLRSRMEEVMHQLESALEYVGRAGPVKSRFYKLKRRYVPSLDGEPNYGYELQKKNMMYIPLQSLSSLMNGHHIEDTKKEKEEEENTTKPSDEMSHLSSTTTNTRYYEDEIIDVSYQIPTEEAFTKFFERNK